jgi:hypothetical protein
LGSAPVPSTPAESSDARVTFLQGKTRSAARSQGCWRAGEDSEVRSHARERPGSAGDDGIETHDVAVSTGSGALNRDGGLECARWGEVETHGATESAPSVSNGNEIAWGALPEASSVTTTSGRAFLVCLTRV